jgi:sulfate adenylyltransferase
MSKLVRPHGAEQLKPLLLEGDALAAERQRAQGLPKIHISSRETGDLIMLGIGGFTPLDGFMTRADWEGVCDGMKMVNGLFWPIPITLSTDQDTADTIKTGTDIALADPESDEIMATMKVTEKYSIDKEHECAMVFKTTDAEHPGVKMVMEQGAVNHEYLVKIAIEICDGVMIHSLLGKLKPGDIPSKVRVKAINALVENYFVKDTVVQSGYPLDMRYAGPREALLHALFRQNYGCSHLIVGRDHAGVGEYYGPFDAQHIFDEIPADALETQALKIDWTFYCYKCGGMASMRTCPHEGSDRLLLSGTKLRKALSENGDVPSEFSRPEVLTILREYYANLAEHEKVEVKLSGHSAR